MSQDVNYALASNGASIADVSREALHVASAASNLLLEREDMLWITGDVPQFVTVRVAAQHPPLQYVGWHVWHDYLSNPKVVSIASGVLPDCLTPVMTCNALPGAGTQLWELPHAIPPAHCFVRFTIEATFAPGPTYMNNLALFATHPGPAFSSHHQSTVSNDPPHRSAVAPPPVTQAGNHSAAQPAAPAGTMSNLLRDLDEDIRALHPIRTVSPTKNIITFNAATSSLPSIVDAEIGEYIAAASRRSPSTSQGLYGQPQAPHDAGVYGRGVAVRPPSPQPPHDALSVIDNTTFRLAALEQAVTSLTRAMENQRQDIVAIKELLSQRPVAAQQPQQQQRQRSKNGADEPPQRQSHPPPPMEVTFPEEALRNVIEDVLAPKLAKYSKRAESKAMEKLDEHLAKMLEHVSEDIDQRVRGYLNHMVRDHGVLPSSAGAAERGAQRSTYSTYTSGATSLDTSRVAHRSTGHVSDISRDDLYDRPTRRRY